MRLTIAFDGFLTGTTVVEVGLVTQHDFLM